MKFKKIFFYIILSIMFIIPSQIKAAEYKVCVYTKNLDGNAIAGVMHVVNGTVKFDIYRKGTLLGTIVSALSSAENQIEKTQNVLYSNSTSYKPSELQEGCPSTVCEGTIAGGKNNAWVDTTCNIATTNQFDLKQAISEGSVVDLNEELAFSFAGGNGNVTFSTMLGTCPSEVGPFKLLGVAYSLLKIIAPVALLLFATLDIGKAVAAGDDGKVKKAQQAAMKRLVAAMIVFLSFVMVQYIVKLASNGSDIMSCVEKIIG